MNVLNKEGAHKKVHMFWAYGDLTMLERLAAISFVANGFDLKFWTYEAFLNLPENLQQCDAREIIPEHRVFQYKNGSYAGFSNFFRYAVLSKQGGLWADTDVVCLTSFAMFKDIARNGFLVTERTKNSINVNSNLIYHPHPSAGDIIDLALAVTDRFPVDKLEWGDCGPRLLATLVKAYPKLAPRIMKPEFANPIPWRECPDGLLNDSNVLPTETYFLHCFNEMWRKSATDKNAPYPPGSILGKVFARYADRLG